MIGSLRGRIASKTPPQLTVDVGGLGYELEAPMSTFFHLPAVLRPTPGIRVRAAMSSRCTHSANAATLMPESSARAIFGPTPDT